MRYYPVCLDVKGRTCLVVGGGEVGTRKALTLMACGASVTVVSPAPSPLLISVAEEGRLVIKEKFYDSSDLDGVFLVIGTTDRPDVNLAVARDAEARGLLHNIADNPDDSSFILPAVLSRGDLQVAVSTSGKSPALARRIKKELEVRFGDEYAVMLRLMGMIREKLLSLGHDPEDHRARFTHLVSGRLIDLIREGETERIDLLLEAALGAGFSLKELGIRIPTPDPGNSGRERP